jgi:hypothetical protein
VAGRTQQIGFGTWYSSSQQPGTREAGGLTRIVVAQDEMFDAAAAGATVTAAASLPVSGTAIGTAAAAGGTVATTAAIVAGTASSTVTGAASGAIITASVSVLSGATSGAGMSRDRCLRPLARSSQARRAQRGRQ